MFEDILANTSLPPTWIILGVSAAMIGIWLGWVARGFGASRRETSLKQEVLSAKGSVPQLESSLKLSEGQVERLSNEVQTLKDENVELVRARDVADKTLQRTERQVSRLNSEINAVRGIAREEDNLVIDGFEDEVAHESKEDSALQTRLKKTEAAYEKLKEALIKRDDRIDALEEQLHAAGEGGEQAGEQTAVDGEDTRKLRRELEGQRDTIKDLQAQLGELKQEKDMLEELASRRSKTNRALKDASAEIKEQLEAHEAEVNAREQTIQDREASISRLLKETDGLKTELGTSQADCERLQSEVEAKSQSLAAMETELGRLKTENTQHQQHIEQLDGVLSDLQNTVAQLETRLEHADAQAEAHVLTENKLTETTQQLQTLEESVKAKDLKYAKRTAELEKLAGLLVNIKAQLADAKAAAAKGIAAAEARMEEKRAEVARLKQEIDDQTSVVGQQERWVGKLKKSLADRETLNADLQQQVETLKTEMASMDAELQYQREAQDLLETEKSGYHTKATDFEAQLERTEVELSRIKLELAKLELTALQSEPPAPPQKAAVTANPETAAPPSTEIDLTAACQSAEAAVEPRPSPVNGVAAPAARPIAAGRRSGPLGRRREPRGTLKLGRPTRLNPKLRSVKRSAKTNTRGRGMTARKLQQTPKSRARQRLGIAS